ncbi:MAG: signal peptide peptidase SppA, partial [Treponema sp.]|nr:signal peptide peptidase SppA [Treponema sp.]
YFESMAASGGYYIACAATKIVANRNTLTGSIGVIAGQSLDLTGLMEKYGVKSETIHAGKNKNMGNYNEPMTDEQRQILQSIADECYEQFTEIVANARKMSIDKVQELADGRVYTAKQALSAGLVDSIGSFDDAEKLMEEKEFEGEDYMVEDYKYERYPNFYDYLYGLSSKIVPGKAESITGLPEAVEKVIDPEVKYPAFIYEQ